MFVSDFVKMTSTTTGTGALTLVAASAPYQSLATALTAAWGTGTFECAYTVEEASTGKFESGIGSFVTSTLVLTRTLVQQSFDGSALDYTAPAAINFASGALTVYISDAIGNQPWVYPGTGNNAAVMGASTTMGLVPFNKRTGGSTLTAVVSTEYYSAILWSGTHQIDQVTHRTGTSTTGNCKLAWYEMKQSGIPGAKVFNFGAFAVGGSGTNSVLAVTGFNPPPGWYVEASIFDATVASQNSAFTIQTPFGQTTGGVEIVGYTRSGTYASGLADPASTASPTALTGVASSVALPLFSYRMAA